MLCTELAVAEESPGGCTFLAREKIPDYHATPAGEPKPHEWPIHVHISVSIIRSVHMCGRGGVMGRTGGGPPLPSAAGHCSSSPLSPVH